MSKCNKCKYEYSSKLDEPCKYCREKFGVVTLGYQMSEDKFVPKEEQATYGLSNMDDYFNSINLELYMDLEAKKRIQELTEINMRLVTEKEK